MNSTLQLTQATHALARPVFTPVFTGILQRKCACGGDAGIDGECEECRKRRLQRKAVSSSGRASAPAIVHSVLRSAGQPLDAATRAFFEPRFGYDFSRVRIHADARAAESARAVGAAAYAVGSDIVFRNGLYSPGTEAGRALLAHELTHVIQQTPRLSRQPAESGATGDAAKTQRSASDRLAALAAHVEGFANQAESRVNALGPGADVDAIRRNIGTARTGVTGLRQLAANGDNGVAAAVLGNFSRDRLKAASDSLLPARISAPLVASIESQAPEIAAKPIEISQPYDAAEIEADHIASAVLSGQPAAAAAVAVPPVLQRFQSAAANAALEKELAAMEELSTTTETTEVGATLGEAALGTEAAEAAGATLLGIGPVGWAIIAVAVVVVAVVAVGVYYYSTQDEAKKTAPAPSPAPSPAPAPAPAPKTVPQTEEVPKDCTETAKRISTDKCKMTATTSHAGGDPVADLFCEEQTHDPCEYRTYAASGIAYFDSIRGRDAYECKCGYLSLVRAERRGEEWASRALNEKIEQIRRHIRVSKDCELQYRVIVSNDEVADWFRSQFGSEIDVIVEHSEFCD